MAPTTIYNTSNPELPNSPCLSAMVREAIRILQAIQGELSSGPPEAQALKTRIAGIQASLAGINISSVEAAIAIHREAKTKADDTLAHIEFRGMNKNRWC